MADVTIDQAFEWARQRQLAGQLAEAERVYRQILAQQPSHAPSLHFLGLIAHTVGRNDDDVFMLRRAVAFDPNVPGYLQNLGSVLHAMGRHEEAEASDRRAVELAPNVASIHNNLGNSLQGQGRLAEAVTSFREAVRLDPNLGWAHNNMANALFAMGDIPAAMAAFREAARCMPDVAGVQTNMGNMLASIGRLDEAIACYRRSIELDPRQDARHSNLLMALQYHPDLSPEQLLAEHVAWAQRFADPLTASAPPHRVEDHAVGSTRRLRVAYVSPDFRDHPVAFFMEPILRAHDRAAVEVVCYSDVAHADAVTDRLSKLPEHWRVTLSMSDAQFAEQVRRDGIDVLVDLSAHSGQNRLPAFARKPAPVQVTYLGYATTTGMKAMDWRITDAIVDPPGTSEAHSTERLLRLPRVFCSYEPWVEAPQVGPLPAEGAGHVTFGSLCTLAKVNAGVIERWSQILSASSGSRLLIRARGLEDAGLRGELVARFARLGVSPDRLEILGGTGLLEYFETFNRIDVMLDAFPFAAHTTTCHALWMGVPVVTLTGVTTVSRVSASVLSAVGLARFVADSPQRYVEIATSLAADVPRLCELRRTLRDRLRASPLLDGAGMARELEKAYRFMFAEWARQAAR
jgi:predicted O-linked N-acetylglucosamine transferase (SPINDLY family)